jgi:hypothetical protein
MCKCKWWASTKSGLNLWCKHVSHIEAPLILASSCLARKKWNLFSTNQNLDMPAHLNPMKFMNKSKLKTNMHFPLFEKLKTILNSKIQPWSLYNSWSG